MSRFCLTLGWDDAPHLTDQQKTEMLAALPPHQRDARSKGIPQLGSGAIYPIEESNIVVDDIEIPAHWPRGFALDVGWNKTAALWGALDRESDCLYLYSEYYRGQAEPAIHAQGILARGDWIPGVVDPAARGRGQKDGIQLFEMYRDLGLDLETANNAVETGIYEVWMRFSSGRLKIFKSCVNLRGELRVYRRDERGRIVKENDHLADCARYLVMSGIARAKTKPVPKTEREHQYDHGSSGTSWMG